MRGHIISPNILQDGAKLERTFEGRLLAAKRPSTGSAMRPDGSKRRVCSGSPMHRRSASA